MTANLVTTARRLKERIERRLELAAEDAFTLTELLIVLVVMGILLEMSVPAYTSIQASAQQKAALTSVQGIKPALALYFSDNGTYRGASIANLNSRYNLNLSTKFDLPDPKLTDTSFCATYTESPGGYVAVLQGPGDLGSVDIALTCP